MALVKIIVHGRFLYPKAYCVFPITMGCHIPVLLNPLIPDAEFNLFSCHLSDHSAQVGGAFYGTG